MARKKTTKESGAKIIHMCADCKEKCDSKIEMYIPVTYSHCRKRNAKAWYDGDGKVLGESKCYPL